MAEFAATLPILLLIIVGTMDLGRAIYVQNVMTNAAREGTRYGTIMPDDVSGIENRVRSVMIGPLADDVTITSTKPSPETIRVTLTYDFTAATPLLNRILGAGGTITLTAVSTMNIEGW